MKYLLSVFLVAIGVFALGQDTLNIERSSSEKSDDKKPHQDMMLVDFNWDRLLGLNGPVKQKWYGRGISVALMYDYPLNRNGNYSIAIGGGFTSHNYYTNALVVKNAALDVAEFQAQPSTIKDKGKISLNYLDVPVELRFRTNEDSREHRWKVAVGGRVGYRINVHEKIIDNNDFKTKLYYYPHTALFRYGPTLRFGYGAVMLTGYYSLSTFFQTGKGMKDMNALSIGLTISPF
ncbi:MAG: outer membrane beta-barrel protein [Flavobacteriales bacterium]